MDGLRCRASLGCGQRPLWIGSLPKEPLTFADVGEARAVFPDVAHREFWILTLGLFLKYYLFDGVHPNADRYWKRILKEPEDRLVPRAAARRRHPHARAAPAAVLLEHGDVGEQAALTPDRDPPPRFPLGVAAVGVLLQLATGGRYGLFRDELYYLACADHLGWGYVDHPPLSIAVLWATRALLGDGLLAVRLVPSILLGVLIVLASRIARELGGGAFAQSLAAIAVLAAPQYLGNTGYFSMNSLDLVFWAMGALLIARLCVAPSTRLWIVLGLVLGLGLMNKISVLFLGFGLGVALVVTPLRRELAGRGPWVCGAIAAALFSPHLLWQIGNGWPTLEFIHNATFHKNAPLTAWQFLGAQIVEIHPFNAPIWLLGLGSLLFGSGRSRRGIGVIYLASLAVFLAQHAKPYYLGPAYTMLLAAGAVAVERRIARGSWLRVALPVVLLMGGAITAPLAIPVLPVETFIAYQRGLGLRPTPGERLELGPLPQHFADRFGWQELTAAVAAVYASLPEDEKSDVTLVTDNYGEAGALLYYGKRYGLPRAVCQHNSFYLWGLGRDRVSTVIVVGMATEDLDQVFESVTPAGRFSCPYAMPYEVRRPIHVCRGLEIPLDEAWRQGRRYI